MKKLITIFLCAAMSFDLSAQDGKVKGRVLDQTGNPVQDVIVSMFSADSTYLGMMLTGESGDFGLSSAATPFILHFDHISYESLRKECTSFNVGDVILKESGNELEKAKVTAYKPIVKIEEAALRYDLQQLAANTTAQMFMRLSADFPELTRRTAPSCLPEPEQSR